jgi:hypothetical protein
MSTREIKQVLLGLNPFVLIEMIEIIGEDAENTVRVNIDFGGGLVEEDLHEIFTVLAEQTSEDA